MLTASMSSALKTSAWLGWTRTESPALLSLSRRSATSALFGVGVRHRDQFNFGQPQHGAQVRELVPVVEADRGDANGALLQ